MFNRFKQLMNRMIIGENKMKLTKSIFLMCMGFNEAQTSNLYLDAKYSKSAASKL